MMRAGGDFDEVFERLFPLAGRVAYRIVGDRAQAEDIAAEACARALARWSRVGPLSYRDAWILRVAANLALDALRRRRTVPEPPPVALDLDDGVVLRVALLSALDGLSRRQREVIVLRYLVGLRDEDVAAALGISEGTVRTQAQRALSSLRSGPACDLGEVAL